MAELIDGKKISMDVKMAVKEEVSSLKERGVSACLAVVIVGNDPASRVYVNNKKKACELVGIESREYALADNGRGIARVSAEAKRRPGSERDSGTASASETD